MQTQDPLARLKQIMDAEAKPATYDPVARLKAIMDAEQPSTNIAPGSGLGFLERAKLSLSGGSEEAEWESLKNMFGAENVISTPKGHAVRRTREEPFQMVDPSGPDWGDFGDMAGGLIEAGAGTVGGVLGAAGGIPGAVAGAALGESAGTAFRLGLAELMGVETGVNGVGDLAVELGKSALVGAGGEGIGRGLSLGSKVLANKFIGEGSGGGLFAKKVTGKARETRDKIFELVDAQGGNPEDLERLRQQLDLFPSEITTSGILDAAQNFTEASVLISKEIEKKRGFRQQWSESALELYAKELGEHLDAEGIAELINNTAKGGRILFKAPVVEANDQLVKKFGSLKIDVTELRKEALSKRGREPVVINEKPLPGGLQADTGEDLIDYVLSITEPKKPLKPPTTLAGKRAAAKKAKAPVYITLKEANVLRKHLRAVSSKEHKTFPGGTARSGTADLLQTPLKKSITASIQTGKNPEAAALESFVRQGFADAEKFKPFIITKLAKGMDPQTPADAESIIKQLFGTEPSRKKVRAIKEVMGLAGSRPLPAESMEAGRLTTGFLDDVSAKTLRSDGEIAMSKIRRYAYTVLDARSRTKEGAIDGLKFKNLLLGKGDPATGFGGYGIDFAKELFGPKETDNLLLLADYMQLTQQGAESGIGSIAQRLKQFGALTQLAQFVGSAATFSMSGGMSPLVILGSPILLGRVMDSSLGRKLLLDGFRVKETSSAWPGLIARLSALSMGLTEQEKRWVEEAKTGQINNKPIIIDYEGTRVVLKPR